MGNTMPKRIDLKSVNFMKKTTSFEKDEIRKLYAEFRSISGGEFFIKRDQFEKAFLDTKMASDKKFIDSLFEIFDSERTDVISFREFCTAMAVLCSGSLDETLEAVFQMYDTEGNDFISKKEMAEVLTVFGQTLEMKEFSGDHCDSKLDSVAEIQKFVDQVFADSTHQHPDKLTLEEFKAAVYRHPLLKQAASTFINHFQHDFFIAKHKVDKSPDGRQHGKASSSYYSV
eukprot:NODE_5714_length_917_cov_4.409320_g5490_i0.p1 GENE.NODE_5714_length_917_cov_4.409320_g5490_i0~~NODE_5714_length_917_cov_4.409320_g5490_i0.p1  ORF type:complete len:229 (-),score=42.47 NODE_5714_length_917_cov_4.409320_g5490_i0:162-848(-)